MRALLARALVCIPALSSCSADRWFGSVSRGDGEIDGVDGKVGGYDVEDYRVELGLSGPLFDRPERERRAPCPAPPAAVPPLAPAPAVCTLPHDGGEIPWETIITTFVLSVAGYEGSKRALPPAMRKARAIVKKPTPP